MNDDNLVESIMKDYDKDGESKQEYEQNREKRVKKLLSYAGLKTEEDWKLYVDALSVSSSGYSIIMVRDIAEMFINSYNPEWILAWNGNMDIQICLDYFAVIVYITEYFLKDDTGTMSVLIEAIKNCDSDSL